MEVKLAAGEPFDDQHDAGAGWTAQDGWLGQTDAWRYGEQSAALRLRLANMIRAKAFGRTMEVLRKIFHRVDVGTYGALRVVAMLEFIQHLLPKMGHNNLLVTQTLHRQHNYSKASAAASIAPAT